MDRELVGRGDVGEGIGITSYPLVSECQVVSDVVDIGQSWHGGRATMRHRKQGVNIPIARSTGTSMDLLTEVTQTVDFAQKRVPIENTLSNSNLLTGVIFAPPKRGQKL